MCVLHNDKGVNTRGYITFANIYVLNVEAPKYVKQVLSALKRETNSNSRRHRYPTFINACIIQMENEQGNPDLKHDIKPDRLTRYLLNIPSKTTQYTFLSSAHGTFSKVDRMLGHKISLNIIKEN